MDRLLLLISLFACGGCAFPIHHTLTDQPPYNTIAGKTIVTAQSAYLIRDEAHPPQESFPSKDYRYYVAPASFHLMPGLKWLGPKIPLPLGSRMMITKVSHITYPPLPSYSDTDPFNEMEATIISGPFAGTRVWSVWGNSPQEAGDLFSFAR